MGPKIDINTLVAKFNDEVEDWDRSYKAFSNTVKQGKISRSLGNQIKELYEKVESAFKGVRKGDPDYKNNHSRVEELMKKVEKEFFSVLQNSKSKSDDSSSDTDKESEESVSINKLIAKFDTFEEMVNTCEERLQKQYNSVPEPTNISVSLTNEAYESIKEIKKEASKMYVDLKSLVNKNIKYEEQKKKVEQKWTEMTEGIADKLAAAEEYISKYGAVSIVEPKAGTAQETIASGNNASTSQPGTFQQNKQHLERLPLPSFDGTKMNYQRFKKEFSNHVTYQSDKERMLALKTKCLLNKSDRYRVQNEQSLKECWARLDEEYGDINTLVADIFLSWQNLKPPKTDAEFIKFVTVIENGVSCLRSLEHEKDLDNTYMAVTVENKLNIKMKNQFSEEYTSDESPDKQRMKSLLKYLIRQKKAAHMRSCNYKPNKDEQDEEPVKSSFTGSRGGRGGRGSRGRGGQQHQVRQEDDGGQERGGTRGRGNGARGRGGKPKRGETSKTCLVCGKDHSTGSCDTWRSVSISKGDLFIQAHHLQRKICLWCLEPGHYVGICNADDELGCPCGKSISKYICNNTPDCKSRKNWTSNDSKTKAGSGNTSYSGPIKPNGVPMGGTLLPVQDVDTSHGYQLKTMFDNCSQTSFLSEETARARKLKGVPVRYTLVCTDGREEPQVGRLYNLILKDRFGRPIHIQAVGIKKLSSKFGSVRVLGIKEVFPDHDVTDEDLEREGGNLDLLLGTDLAELHPTHVQTKDKLVLFKSKFGSGWTVCGFDNDIIESTGDEYSKVNHSSAKDLQFLDLISSESVGIDVPKRCSNCKSCKECKLSSQRVSYLETLEDKIIEDSIEYMEDKKRYKVSYPYTKEIYELLPNEQIARERAIQLEKTLMKSPTDLESANKILKDSFDRGVFQFLTEEQLSSWDGVVHYLAMNRSYKESKSTPCRLTFDSGQPDKNGRSLNGCMGKGRNPLNYFGGVVVNWRAAEQVACGDISKMFNQCEVREQDMHVRRFFVRPDGFGGKEPWKIAVVTVVNFGEKSAGTIATAIKDKTARESEHITPDVCKMIIKNFVMDDVNISEKYGNDINVKIKQAEEIMANGGFRFKEWIKSGEEGDMEIGRGISKALGVCWETKKDQIVFKVRLNFGKKVRNRRTKPYSFADTIEKDFPQKFTKRIALSLTHTIFDPTQLIQPFILRLRLSYRNIIIQEKLEGISSWDRELSDKTRDEWLKLAKIMFELEQISFDRSLVPRGYNSEIKPMLLLFSDGSDTGQCVVAYLRWEMSDGSVQLRIVTSRVKIASLNKITTPMSELLAAQLSSRLKVWLAETLDINLGLIVHLVDSSIVLGMIQNI